MPLFDYLCPDCGQTSEILTGAGAEAPVCPACGGNRLKKLLSAHSSFSGVSRHALPGQGDTACCGSTPGHAGCAGPGSCCGRKAP
jgi:putative FmdB family regulatory protein